MSCFTLPLVQYIQSEFSDILRLMTKRAENEIRKRIEAAGEPSMIEQLCLDSIEIKNFTPNIKKMLQSCTNLEYLTLNDCAMKSLEHFPNLRSLIVLELSDNKLTGQDLNRLTLAPRINFLTIDNNSIAESQYLQQLSCLRELQILQVHDNPLTTYFHYRQEVFRTLPTLKAVDCEDREGNKVEEEDPSEYFSCRQPRSRFDLADLLDDDGQSPFKSYSKTAAEYQENRDKEQKKQAALGNFYASSRNVRRYHSDVMTFRTKAKESSDSDDDEQKKNLIGDFCKKFHKSE